MCRAVEDGLPLWLQGPDAMRQGTGAATAICRLAGDTCLNPASLGGGVAADLGTGDAALPTLHVAVGCLHTGPPVLTAVIASGKDGAAPPCIGAWLLLWQPSSSWEINKDNCLLQPNLAIPMDIKSASVSVLKTAPFTAWAWKIVAISGAKADCALAQAHTSSTVQLASSGCLNKCCADASPPFTTGEADRLLQPHLGGRHSP